MSLKPTQPREYSSLKFENCCRVTSKPQEIQSKIMGEKKKQSGRQNRKTGTAKQVKEILEKQEDLKSQLQSVCNVADDTKTNVNSKIISIIDTAVKPLLKDKRDEWERLSNQKGGNKNQQQARAEALEALKTDIEDLLVITNLMSLLALANPGTRCEYTKILCRLVRIAGLEGNSYNVSFRKIPSNSSGISCRDMLERKTS